MWEEQADPDLNRQEKNFQKMLVNNMESVFQIFFRGMNTMKLRTNKTDKEALAEMCNIEQSLTVLEKKKIV